MSPLSRMMKTRVLHEGKITEGTGSDPGVLGLKENQNQRPPIVFIFINLQLWGLVLFPGSELQLKPEPCNRMGQNSRSEWIYSRTRGSWNRNRTQLPPSLSEIFPTHCDASQMALAEPCRWSDLQHRHPLSVPRRWFSPPPAFQTGESF